MFKSNVEQYWYGGVIFTLYDIVDHVVQHYPPTLHNVADQCRTILATDVLCSPGGGQFYVVRYWPRHCTTLQTNVAQYRSLTLHNVVDQCRTILATDIVLFSPGGVSFASYDIGTDIVQYLFLILANIVVLPGMGKS